MNEKAYTAEMGQQRAVMSGQLRAQTGMDVRLTYRQQLLSQKESLDTRSMDLGRALEILDKHPEIEELLSIVGRVL